MNIILFSIPIFFLLITAELIAEKVRKTDYYRLNDAITSLSIGALSRIITVGSINLAYQSSFVIFSSVNLAWTMENRASAILLEWLKLLLSVVLLLTMNLGTYADYAFIPVVLSAILLFKLQHQHNIKLSSGSELNKDLGS